MTTELKDRLHEEARRNTRSLNSEIVKRLEDSLSKENQQLSENKDDFENRISVLEDMIEKLKKEIQMN
ncbi:MAG TPA: Arc family DNA-binding protein [Arsenophonus nasoniae]|uniref:Arc family DNA-binding protein n=1 Tax=Arsenophonus nasoniae TaxID=638 RepID=UPI00387A0205